MRVYISGPITGVPNYRENFERAEKILAEAGYTVVNPAKVGDALPDDFTHEEYLAVDLELLSLCDAVYLLKGWECSNGAQREYHDAIMMDKTFLFE